MASVTGLYYELRVVYCLRISTPVLMMFDKKQTVVCSYAAMKVEDCSTWSVLVDETPSQRSDFLIDPYDRDATAALVLISNNIT